MGLVTTHKVLKWVKEYLGPLFVLFEAGMHIYLTVYLALHWANWPIWLFTAFEMTMFIYLLINRKKGGVLR
jgi:hypothetical protein